MCIFRLLPFRKASDATKDTESLCVCARNRYRSSLRAACAFVHYVFFIFCAQSFFRNETIPRQHRHKHTHRDKNRPNNTEWSEYNKRNKKKITTTLPTARCIFCLSLHLYFFFNSIFFLDLMCFSQCLSKIQQSKQTDRDTHTPTHSHSSTGLCIRNISLNEFESYFICFFFFFSRLSLYSIAASIESMNFGKNKQNCESFPSAMNIP